MLQGPQSHIWLAEEDVPDPARLDLILTDHDASGQPTSGFRGQGAGARGQGSGFGVQDVEFDLWREILNPEPRTLNPGPRTLNPFLGVIRIGVEGPADLRLPADVTERELRLACRLLAEVVRLRRKDHARSQSQRRLAAEALTDPLTGLPNRRAWDRALLERVAEAADLPGRICLAVIDLDHFKRVNDTHGHAAGDEVLRAAGKVIRGSLRESDFVARLGGDEFGLLLSVADEQAAQAVVDRVRRGLAAGLARDGTAAITASAGFCVAPSRDSSTPLPSPDALFLAADTALREAKHAGRDRTVGGNDEG